MTKLSAPGYLDYAVGGFEQECSSRKAHCGPARFVANTVAWRIEALADTRLRLPVFLLPMWKVVIDGKPVPAVHDVNSGLIEVSLAPGAHEVELVWTETSLFATARWISIASLVVLILLAVFGRLRTRAAAGPAFR